ncbi:MAG: Rne/Rng family ribonuclease [Polyangiaceae bacterium]|nr:Rne/Rng family ribonuclease [Polyangiaceae bacterium]
MGNNIVVINCDLRETRVALIEDGVIAELQIERASSRGTLGNVVLGKVSRVLPGMQAAFIEIGLERAAFLHVEDLIRPDDFEAYLGGDAREDSDTVERGEGGRRHGAGADDEDDDEDVADAAPSAESPAAPAEEPTADVAEVGAGAAEPIVTRAAARRRIVSAPAPAVEPEGGGEAEPVAEDVTAEVADDEDDDSDDLRGEAEEGDDADTEEADDAAEGPIADAPEHAASAPPADGVPAEPGAEPAAAQRDARGSRRRRRRRKGKEQPAPEAKGRPAAQPRDARGDRGQPRKANGARVSRSVPITEVVKEGDEVIVQVSKEPIGTKGARVTSHVSLAGRYVVYLPTVEHVGISKRIGSHAERARLRRVLEPLKPKTGGLIVRTVGEGLTKKDLKADIGYLIRLWGDIAKKRENAKAPVVLYEDLGLVLKVARDLFNDDVKKIVIDDREQHARLVRFVEMFMPGRVKDVELYTGDEPIFDAFGIEDEIARALSRKVPLPSGGYLILDQAEALTAIDVNTGRFVGKGSKDLEETALKTNLEAVAEIAYQLRFRNIGGLVILDLIDMDHAGNRDRVYRALEQALAKDKAKTTINRISELGLIEMTRKRTRESLGRTMHEPCFYCDGTGQIQSRYTIAYEILRQIRRERHQLPGYVIVVNAHPAIVDLLGGEERVALQEAERRYMRQIQLTPHREYHIEQFDLQGK